MIESPLPKIGTPNMRPAKPLIDPLETISQTLLSTLGCPSLNLNSVYLLSLVFNKQGRGSFTCRCLPLKVTKHSERSEECDPQGGCNALGGRALRLRLRAAPRTPARADTLARVRPLRARGGREIC
jgi:hypothetical protein